jgi:TolA-binding protein
MAEYQRLLRAAQEKFNAANYGQAIVQYGEIGEKFDDGVTEGSHHYWIGLSWFYLKEMQLAEQSFKKLIDHFNHNSWVPYARFYTAKIDLNRGLSGRARDQFKLLIDEYPNQDLGEMARMEIDRMREKL